MFQNQDNASTVQLPAKELRRDLSKYSVASLINGQLTRVTPRQTEAIGEVFVSLSQFGAAQGGQRLSNGGNLNVPRLDLHNHIAFAMRCCEFETICVHTYRTAVFPRCEFTDDAVTA